MSRNYDISLSLTQRTNTFEIGDIVEQTGGASARGIITQKEDENKVYVRFIDDEQEFQVNRGLRSSSSNFSRTKQDPNTTAPFNSRHQTNRTADATARISAISYNRLFAQKNALQQPTSITLFTFYYPGELYSQDSELPTNGYDWPYQFPLRWAQPVFGLGSNYTISSNGKEYPVIPYSMGGINQTEDGAIGTVRLEVFNQNNFLSELVENPYLAGYASSGGISVTKNGQTVKGIDPRTVPGNGQYRRNIVDQIYAGVENAALNYEQTLARNGTWVPLKTDSRDLLGGVLTISTTYVKYLDFWPESSKLISTSGSTCTVEYSHFYRVGDKVLPESLFGTTTNYVNITAISGDTITGDKSIGGSSGERLLIINEEASPEDKSIKYYKVDQLEGLSQGQANFVLTDWLDYFNNTIPKSRYLKGTCRYRYRGDRCGYPGPNGGTIPGSTLTANTNPITITNEIGANNSEDVCAKTLEACVLRNNSHRFGGFIGTGKS